MAAVDTATPATFPKDVKMRGYADEEGAGDEDTNVYKVEYYSFDDFKIKAKRFGIFAEWKDGVPRGAYRGVVTFKMYGGRATVLMVPGRGMQVAKTYSWYKEKEEERAAGAAGGSVGGGGDERRARR